MKSHQLSLSLSLTVFAITTHFVALVCNTLDYDQKYAFKKLENFLQNKLGDNWDVQLNLDAAQSYLNAIESGDIHLKTASWELSRLKPIWENPKCDRAQDLQLFRFQEETQGHRYYAEPEKELKKRIDYIVHQVSLRAAKKCRLEYPKIFNEIYAKLDPKTKELVENFKKDYFIKITSEKDTNIERQKWLLLYRFIGNKSEIDAAVKYLKKVYNETNDYSRRKSAYEIYMEYFKLPCMDYSDQIGSQVLSGAIYDAKMFKGLSGWHFDEYDENLINFYIAIANYRICGIIANHNNKEFQQSVIYELAKII